MTKMIPDSYIGEYEGERKFFEVIRDLPNSNNWYCFHNLYIDTHTSQVSGEIDFLLLAPPLGIFCFEVKGGRVSYANGMWSYGCGTKSYSKKESPFEQARLNSISVKDFLQTNIKTGYAPWVFHAVVFPFSSLPDNVGISGNLHRVADITMMDSGRFKHFLDKLAAADGKGFQFSPQGVKEALKILGPELVISPTLVTLMDEHARITLRYTEEQFKVLDTLAEYNSRVIVAGHAGTGKTVIAIDLALRKAAMGGKVLFLVDNPLLAEHLKGRVDAICDKVDTMTRPVVMAVVDIDETHNNKYDVVFVDEAQDILCNKENLLLLNELIINGLARGSWYMFGDLQYQNLTSSDPLYILRQAFAIEPALFPLTKNLRNTNPIASLAVKLGEVEQASLKLPEKLETDLKIDMRIYDPAQKNSLKIELNRVWEYIRMHDAVKRAVVITGNDETLSDVAKEVTGTQPYSIAQFKGLEADAVILLSPYAGYEGAPHYNYLYTAITRARVMLVCVITAEENEKITTALLKD